MTRFQGMIALVLTSTLAAVATSATQDRGNNRSTSQPATPAKAAGEDWRDAERTYLEYHVQLTSFDRFLKAGEAYFSPDDSKVIFQAIEVPADGEDPEEFYQMFVADFTHDWTGAINGITNIKQLSPPGSSNTCGWFHPTNKDVVIFGTTIVPPSAPNRSGYQRSGSRNYVWQFPQEMTIVECKLSEADGTAASLTPIVSDPDSYLAECALSPDGRHLVYCSRNVTEGDQGGDLRIRDLQTGRDVVVAGNDGYDGGPFFSPDGRRICYRSDRVGNDLLQIFVSELAFDEDGSCVGLSREFQLTDNAHVNWAPFWHPNSRFLVYATSEVSHRNYEVFIVDADQGAVDRPARYGTRVRRVTHAPGFDGLPVFNTDGSLMMWTGQRDENRTSQLWLARFVMDIDGTKSTGRSGYGR
ncbi:MAG: hypothetical protein AAF432_13795 [Planctomycetota bacterium]